MAKFKIEKHEATNEPQNLSFKFSSNVEKDWITGIFLQTLEVHKYKAEGVTCCDGWLPFSCTALGKQQGIKEIFPQKNSC